MSLELGGKNAMVVFPDVDVAAAVEGAVFGMNLNVCQGQSCGSNSRVLVHETIHDEFVERLAARLEEFRVTTPTSEESDMGPLVSQAHFERVSGYVDSGAAEGARLVTGGGRPEEAPDGGYFLRPAAFDRVEQSMKIANDEIFGPVISVLPLERLRRDGRGGERGRARPDREHLDERSDARPQDRRAASRPATSGSTTARSTTSARRSAA